MMTDLDALHAALDRDPENGVLRGLIADALDETAESVSCPWCENGAGLLLTTREWLPAYTCPACSDTRYVSDGRAETAAGYRAMATLGLRPSNHVEPYWYWGHESNRVFVISLFAILPDDWRAAVKCVQMTKYWLNFDTRREAEDAAALAFGRLPPKTQSRILAGAS